MHGPIWYTVPREALRDVLFGDCRFLGHGSNDFVSEELRGAPILLGFQKDVELGARGIRPFVIAMDEAIAPETLSWLRVFDRSVFPLSQFGRVVGFQDIQLLLESDRANFEGSECAVWACLVLGEVLASVDSSNTKLAAVPLSQALSTLAFVLGRASFLHGREGAVRDCFRRLALLQNDALFLKKGVSLGDIEFVNRFLNVGSGSLSTIADIHWFISGAGRALAQSSVGTLAWDSEQATLLGDSAEGRVVGYNRLLVSLRDAHLAKKVSLLEVAIYVGGAAYLVGRGTGHLFLLKRSGEFSGVASLWFGLVAGLHGARGWDDDWTRAALGVEKHLRQELVWSCPSIADLAWIEYQWLSKAVSGRAVFANLSRFSARAVSIEVLPGVVCQMRPLAQPEVKTKSTRLGGAVSEMQLKMALEQFLALSEKTRKIVETFGSALGDGLTASESPDATPRQDLLPGLAKAPRRNAKKTSKKEI